MREFPLAPIQTCQRVSSCPHMECVQLQAAFLSRELLFSAALSWSRFCHWSRLQARREFPSRAGAKVGISHSESFSQDLCCRGTSSLRPQAVPVSPFCPLNQHKRVQARDQGWRERLCRRQDHQSWFPVGSFLSLPRRRDKTKLEDGENLNWCLLNKEEESRYSRVHPHSIVHPFSRHQSIDEEIIPAGSEALISTQKKSVVLVWTTPSTVSFLAGMYLFW